MTGLGTTIGSLLAAGVVAAGSLLGSGSGAHHTRTALVIDAGLARDGRELVAPRLRALDAELRLPRSAAEAATDVRYLAARGYRLEVAGPDSRAAAKATGIHVATLRR
jgi:hypothetical protein